MSRGIRGNEFDNRGIVLRVIQLRAERAKLLGYPTHAHWRLERCPFHLGARTGMGYVEVREGRDEEARRLLEGVAEVEPEARAPGPGTLRRPSPRSDRVAGSGYDLRQ